MAPSNRASIVRRRGLAVVVLMYLTHYLRSVQRVRIHSGSGLSPSVVLRMNEILSRCPTIGSRYWPTLFAHLPMIQFLLLLLKEVKTRLFALVRLPSA